MSENRSFTPKSLTPITDELWQMFEERKREPHVALAIAKERMGQLESELRMYQRGDTVPSERVTSIEDASGWCPICHLAGPMERCVPPYDYTACSFYTKFIKNAAPQVLAKATSEMAGDVLENLPRTSMPAVAAPTVLLVYENSGVARAAAQAFCSDKQETPRTDALRSKAGVSSMHFMLDEVLASHEQLERELAESVEDSKAILLENAKLEEALSARGINAELLEIIRHNESVDDNGDPIGGKPETSWELGYAAGIRCLYRFLSKAANSSDIEQKP